MTKKILIAGATGVVGHTALEHFAASGEWEAIAVSRHKPDHAKAMPYSVWSR